jgi:hypothetical protein
MSELIDTKCRALFVDFNIFLVTFFYVNFYVKSGLYLHEVIELHESFTCSSTSEMAIKYGRSNGSFHRVLAWVPGSIPG